MLFDKVIFLQLKEFVKCQNTIYIYIYIKFILLDKKSLRLYAKKRSEFFVSKIFFFFYKNNSRYLENLCLSTILR